MHEELKEGAIVKRETTYTIGEKVGSGSQGDAYRLTSGPHTFIGKVSKGDLRAAVREAERLREYHHENIVRYVEDFVERDRHVLVMEDCQGGDLKTFIQDHGGKPENLDTYLRFVSDIIGGLAEIHSRKHLHRDIKPGNIFIALIKHKDGVKQVARLGDFGLTRDLDTF